MPSPDTDTRKLVRSLHDALITTHSYVSLIAEGKRPAISHDAQEIASGRLERVDAALTDAAEYLMGE